MLLSYNRLLKVVEDGVINALVENINSTSIDLTLDDKILIECDPHHSNSVVKLHEKKSIHVREIDIRNGGYILLPGQFILASSVEYFNLPLNISAEYKLKSTQARNALDHANAGWCDAGWHGKLTLEFKNNSEFHNLEIVAGMKAGQIVFFEHEPVPEEKSYRARGQYNGQQQVTASKGIR